MDRETLKNRFDSKSTRDNYDKAFKKFDEFLESRGQTESDFIKQINESFRNSKYEILQKLIDHIKESVSPRTVRDYFDRLFKYFLLMDCDLDYTKKKLLLKFPRIIQRRLEGLDRPMITKELESCSDNFGVYLRVLAGAGMRETEGLKLEPRMIKFDEFPIRLDLPSSITKFEIPRESFLPPKTGGHVSRLIEEKGIKQNETIFTKNWNEDSLIDFEKYYDKIRKKVGFETKNRKKHQQNDITLHSHRAFYITTFEQNNLKSFGHATAGHSKDMSVYFRTSLEVRRETYAKVMGELDFE